MMLEVGTKLITKETGFKRTITAKCRVYDATTVTMRTLYCVDDIYWLSPHQIKKQYYIVVRTIKEEKE